MRPRHQLVDRSNVTSCVMMDGNVVHPLSILICEDIFAYSDLYFIVLSLFRFPLWVNCSFC